MTGTETETETKEQSFLNKMGWTRAEADALVPTMSELSKRIAIERGFHKAELIQEVAALDMSTEKKLYVLMASIKCAEEAVERCQRKELLAAILGSLLD
jgi:hypothetical protein